MHFGVDCVYRWWALDFKIVGYGEYPTCGIQSYEVFVDLRGLLPEVYQNN
jgi:hypothetical protein